jgi:hypothetical protein
VVDLQGMGKGYAWVNGHSLGRIWPSYNADENGCSDDPCDYRGEYNDTKCVTNCGNPSQRWLVYMLISHTFLYLVNQLLFHSPQWFIGKIIFGHSRTFYE